MPSLDSILVDVDIHQMFESLSVLDWLVQGNGFSSNLANGQLDIFKGKCHAGML